MLRAVLSTTEAVCVSYPIKEIIERIRNVIINEDIRIINLESEDTGAYGMYYIYISLFYQQRIIK